MICKRFGCRRNMLRISFSLSVILSVGCQSSKDEKPVSPDTIIYRTDTSKPTAGPAKKPPIINITDTFAIKQTVLCMKDSALSSERIGLKLNNIYDKVFAEVIRNNKLTKTGSRMAWYKTSSAPFFFEAGLPVNKNPLKLPKNVFVKNIGGDSAVVAHFYGPYELTYEGYSALREWLTDNKQKAAGAPYEIYIGDPLDSKGKARDPYRVQTDIVFPHH
ncbi:MAG: GyrI-like domain-containing protein [Ferruginibacter sp.]